ncbi:MAG: isopentenyl-diphosphate Delta-isomerase [Gammaproteobacteria bacterium]|nr:isopentenyl-diphosphate Delta-isomerase [Gammaproteobacteria bacterium]
MTPTEHVILVDEKDQEIGIAEKIQAHRDNLRHRAFSIFILRKQPKLEILLQKRAAGKYHSAGLWTNTCCSHPRPGEDILAAANRRLFEEMGIHATLKSIGWFHYIAPFPNGLTENENDHVLVGELEQDNFTTNPDEVQDIRWITLAELNDAIAENPTHFTPWLKPALLLLEKNII